ncbi:MAG: endonuclease/exonuclease/phosphatase family protein [Candidatus Sumerlaeaceae bacterium]|nr:endonuclease/exonuclease/phosphatase family protein [Candidatus Sumerlaeaceae bacterium]
MIQKRLKKLLTLKKADSKKVAGAPQPGVIRVLTYNIHHGRGIDGRYDLSRIARAIAAETPHIVALQEIERFRQRSRREDQPRVLAALLKMHYCFASVRDHRHSDQHEGAAYGNAILSKFPIRSTSHFDLTVAGAREPRGCLHALIETPWGPLHVFCVHLGLRYGERAQQMAMLTSEKILKNPRLTPAPAILLGDFNNWWPVRTAKRIQEHFRDACHVTGKKRLRTFGQPVTVLALDYIYATHDIEIVSCYVANSSLARRASDHRPLVSDLKLTSYLAARKRT